MAVRNWMFDHNFILRSEEFDVPIVSVGNLTVGGTGKTPHTEYIVKMLSNDYKIAVLSRGYKRKTKGFLMANSNSTPDSIGDEPLQIYHKFGSRVKVAVCESRRVGIRKLRESHPEIDLIVLDDAYQHRYVKPKVSILLMDFSRPFYEDSILPLGRLREGLHQVNRADMVIVTKCPADCSDLKYRLIRKHLDLMAYQKLYFSAITKGGLLPVFPDDVVGNVSLESLTENDSALLLSGIANPRSFVRNFKDYPFKKKVRHFSDHHDFSREDMDQLLEQFDSLPGMRKIILTTEKDAMRLAYNPYFPERLKRVTYYVPIAVRMLNVPETTDFITDFRKAIES